MQPIEQIKSKDEAREAAKDWQIWAAEQNLSYGELADWAGYFEALGRKYGLIREIKENGIL